MNYIISDQLDVTSENINIAGRQRMLSQKILKDLMLIDFKFNRDESYREHKKAFLNATSLFDQTLMAFIDGGQVISVSGQMIVVDKQSDMEMQLLLETAIDLWKPIPHKLMFVVASVSPYS